MIDQFLGVEEHQIDSKILRHGIQMMRQFQQQGDTTCAIIRTKKSRESAVQWIRIAIRKRPRIVMARQHDAPFLFWPKRGDHIRQRHSLARLGMRGLELLHLHLGAQFFELLNQPLPLLGHPPRPRNPRPELAHFFEIAVRPLRIERILGASFRKQSGAGEGGERQREQESIHAPILRRIETSRDRSPQRAPLARRG